MKVLITPIGVLYILAGVGNAFGALFLFLYALFPALIGVVAIDGTMKGEDGALGAMIMMFGTSLGVGAVGLVVAVLSLLYMVDGVGLIARQGWARWLGLVLAVPMMFACMPVGIIIGVLAFVTLLMPDSAEEFAPVDAPT